MWPWGHDTFSGDWITVTACSALQRARHHFPGMKRRFSGLQKLRLVVQNPQP
jgi:hypothetical protein